MADFQTFNFARAVILTFQTCFSVEIETPEFSSIPSPPPPFQNRSPFVAQPGTTSTPLPPAYTTFDYSDAQ